MSIQQLFSTAASGMAHYTAMIAATGDNLANANTGRPTSQQAFRGSRVRGQEVVRPGSTIGGGVDTVVEPEGSAAGILVHDPSSPLADAQGMLRMPDIELGTQMARLMEGRAGVAMNAAVARRASETYQSVIDILR